MNKEYDVNRISISINRGLGEVKTIRVECPGVYYVEVKEPGHPAANDYYVVEDAADNISRSAKKYGIAVPQDDGLLYYPHSLEKGHHIIEYEIERSKVRSSIGSPEKLREIALTYGDLHPEYFGMYPVPVLTPWGHTVRHRVIMNGVYWIETDRCKACLAVCYPLSEDLDEYSEGLAKRVDEDTFGCCFFAENDSCVPLRRLMDEYDYNDPKIRGFVQMCEA